MELTDREKLLIGYAFLVGMEMPDVSIDEDDIPDIVALIASNARQQTETVEVVEAILLCRKGD